MIGQASALLRRESKIEAILALEAVERCFPSLAALRCPLSQASQIVPSPPPATDRGNDHHFRPNKALQTPLSLPAPRPSGTKTVPYRTLQLLSPPSAAPRHNPSVSRRTSHPCLSYFALPVHRVPAAKHSCSHTYAQQTFHHPSPLQQSPSTERAYTAAALQHRFRRQSCVVTPISADTACLYRSEHPAAPLNELQTPSTSIYLCQEQRRRTRIQSSWRNSCELRFSARPLRSPAGRAVNACRRSDDGSLIRARYTDLQPVGMGAFGLVWFVNNSVFAVDFGLTVFTALPRTSSPTRLLR